MCCWLNVTRRGGGRREDGSLRFIGTISSISLGKVMILNVEHSCSINASESDSEGDGIPSKTKFLCRSSTRLF